MCPNCTSNDYRRSHRKNVGEWVFSWIGLRPFRCQECRIRFWRIGDQLQIDDDRASLIFYFSVLFSHVAAHAAYVIAVLKKRHEAGREKKA
jgi:hypothetical protein